MTGRQPSASPSTRRVGRFMAKPPPGAKPGGPFGLSAPGVLDGAFTSAGIELVRTGDVNCPFQYRSWEEFWRGTRAAGPTQKAIGLAGPEAVEAETRQAVEPFIADDGSISFDPNRFIFVLGRA